MANMNEFACTKIEGELDTIISKLEGFEKGFTKQIQSAQKLMKKIADQVPSPSNRINELADSISNDLPNAVPDDLDDVDQFKNIASQCTGFSVEFNLVDITSLAASFINSVESSITSTLDNLRQGFIDVIEMPVALAIDSLRQLLDKFNIIGTYEKFEGFLDCISILCGGSLDSKVQTIWNYVDDLYLTNNYDLDLDKIYNEVNFPQQMRINVTIISDQIKQSRLTASVKFDSKISSLASGLGV